MNIFLHFIIQSLKFYVGMKQMKIIQESQKFPL